MNEPGRTHLGRYRLRILRATRARVTGDGDSPYFTKTQNGGSARAAAGNTRRGGPPLGTGPRSGQARRAAGSRRRAGRPLPALQVSRAARAGRSRHLPGRTRAARRAVGELPGGSRGLPLPSREEPTAFPDPGGRASPGPRPPRESSADLRPALRPESRPAPDWPLGFRKPFARLGHALPLPGNALRAPYHCR